MKPSAPNKPTPSAVDKEPAAAGVAEELRAIETKPLDRLLEIRKEEAQLEEFRTRAEQMKDKVQDVVWRRVVSDYTKRVAGLEEQATPLRGLVRVEYQKLRALLDRTRALHDNAEIEKSELEFRHAVGELSEKQLEERIRGSIEVLERYRVDLASIDELKARFLSAFGSEAEIDAPAAQPAASPIPAPDVLPPAPTPPDIQKSSASKPAARPVPPPAPAPAPELEPDVTTLAPNPLFAGRAPAAPEPAQPSKPVRAAAAPPAIEPDATSIVSAEQIAAMSRAAEAAADESDDRTFMLPVAGLLINSDTPAASEYRLAAMNYLGRSDESHVVIARPGVSRKHALIVAGTGGFNIKDLESQNGTFVNGQRISEQPLKDGDQIVIGDTKIIFRTPWPAAASGAAS